MLGKIIAKIAVIVVIGAAVGISTGVGSAFPASGSTIHSTTQSVGTFGGPVTHVGTIERDVEQQTSTMVRVPCSAVAQLGTSCYVAR